MLSVICPVAHFVEKTLPASGIKFVSVLLHGHLAATKVRLRHFRNGTELAVISQVLIYPYENLKHY